MLKRINKIIIAITIISLASLTTSCAAKSLKGVSSDNEEIEASIKGTFEQKGSRKDNYLIDLDITLKNISDKEIMKVVYQLDFYDKEQNLLFTINPAWNGIDTPLYHGESITFDYAFQEYTDSKPASVTITVTDVLDSVEVPPVHLPQPGEYLYEAINNDHIKNIKNDLPTRIEIVIDHGGDLETAVIEDKETIQKIVDAFTQVKIDAETEEWVTDNYNSIVFTFADSSNAYISLNLKNLEINVYNQVHIYTLENLSSLWSIMNELADYE